MSDNNNGQVMDYTTDGPHHAARPMKVVVDAGGCNWICDADVDSGKDLEGQGCWRCSDVPFTRLD